MAKKVLLHIGPPKTGTTYVQQILWRNRDRLSEVEVHLPMENRRSHFLAVASLCDPRWGDEPGADTWTWQRFIDDVAVTPGTVVLSEELLASATTEHAAEAVASLAPAEVHVVATVRDLGGLIPSMWQQEVKFREHRRLEEYMAWLIDPAAKFWHRQDAAAVMARWAKHLPSSNLHLVTVPPPDGDGHLLWHRFAEVLGVDPELCDLEDITANPSFGANQIEVLRRFNASLDERLPTPQPYVRAVRFGLVPVMSDAARQSGKIGLAPEWEHWLQQRSQQVVADFNALEVNLVGDWSDLEPARPAGSETVSEAAVATAAVDALAGLTARYDLRLEKICRLQRQLDQERAATARLRARVRRLRRRLDKPPEPTG